MTKLSPAQKFYLAGAFDFKAWIKRSKGRYILKMTCKHYSLAHMLVRKLGGLIEEVKNPKSAAYVWTVYGEKEIYKILAALKVRNPKLQHVARDLYDKYFG